MKVKDLLDSLKTGSGNVEEVIVIDDSTGTAIRLGREDLATKDYFGWEHMNVREWDSQEKTIYVWTW